MLVMTRVHILEALVLNSSLLKREICYIRSNSENVVHMGEPNLIREPSTGKTTCLDDAKMFTILQSTECVNCSERNTYRCTGRIGVI